VNNDPQIIVETLQSPTFVVAGTNNPGYVAFVNYDAPSPRTKSPFVVFVDPSARPAAIASAGHRLDFKETSRLTVLWTSSSDRT
jgi:hypothetical protein